MTTKLIIGVTEDQRQRLNDLCLKEKGSVTSENIEDIASYALLLGMKLMESGLDSDELIRSLQEPGTGLDLDLIMAKRRSRNDKQKPQDASIKDFAKNSSLSFRNIKPDDYDIDFE